MSVRPPYLAKVLLHKLRAHHANKGGGGCIGHGLGKHSLARARWAVHENLYRQWHGSGRCGGSETEHVAGCLLQLQV